MNHEWCTVIYVHVNTMLAQVSLFSCKHILYPPPPTNEVQGCILESPCLSSIHLQTQSTPQTSLLLHGIVCFALVENGFLLGCPFQLLPSQTDTIYLMLNMFYLKLCFEYSLYFSKCIFIFQITLLNHLKKNILPSLFCHIIL